jgi:hypothetical protein
LRKCVVALALILAVVSSPVANPRVPKTLADDRCIANAIYYEARAEPLAGRRAVLDVIENRMLATGKSACGIIKERNQFAWVGKKPMMPMTYQLQEMLTDVRNSNKILINEKFFHSGNKPKWANKMKCRKIARHNFCAEHK